MPFEQIPKIETNGLRDEKSKSIRERLFFPHVEPILKLFEKQFGGAEKMIDPEIIKDILYDFIEQRIERAGVYQSEKQQASFPWGVTDTAELAKKLFESYAGKQLSSELKPSTEKIKKEFVFPSLQSVQSGNQFAFLEEPMHRAIEDLPEALAALKEGKEPAAHEIFTLGSPTNELGTMSASFLEKIKNNNIYDEFGALYSEFIDSAVSAEEKNNTKIFLYGRSMGSSFAVGTAEHLLADRIATQSRKDAEENALPFLQIRLDTPVGSSDIPAARKGWQIPAGFVADTLYTAVADPYARPLMLNDKKFLDSASAIFAEKGMPIVMMPEQLALKKSGIKEAIDSLVRGTPIPENIKVTKGAGLYDPLMYSGDFNGKVKEHKKEHSGSLGQSVQRDASSQRIFGIAMRHSLPNFGKNELNRLQRAAQSLQELKSPPNK